MQYISTYFSPLGEMTISCDEIGVTGIWFVGQKYYGRGLRKMCEEIETEIIRRTKCWLDIYFSGKEPDFDVPLHLVGSDFQKEVWEILKIIPYGKTITYGEIAKRIAERRGKKSMSAQAVGGAVGHNPISIIVPCHRVIGTNGSLTGYAGGIEKKVALLTLEKAKSHYLNQSTSKL